MSNDARARGAALGGALNPWPIDGGGHNPWPIDGGGHNPWPIDGGGHNPWPIDGGGHNPWPIDGGGHNPWPIDGGGHNPWPIDGGGHNPWPIDGGGHNPWPIGGWGPGPARRLVGTQAATRSPWPWRGYDAPWTYSSRGALMAQALRKSRTRLMGERDVRQEVAEGGSISPDNEAPALWFWGAPFRQQAVVGELLGCTRVAGGTVSLIVPAREAGAKGRRKGAAAASPASLSLLPLIEVQGPAAGFHAGRQIDKVLRAAIEREERLPEILCQAEDFRLFFYSLTGLDRVPCVRVNELISLAWSWATHVVMMLKNNLAVARPVQRSQLVMPIIATPAHGSLPSGHATIAALSAHLLAALLYEGAAASARRDSERVADQAARRAARLHTLASRIAFNRVVAGVHFPMDSHIGRHLGAHLAAAFLALARGGTLPADGGRVDVAEEGAEWTEDALALPLPAGSTASGVTLAALPSLALMWQAARRELDQFGL
ncbi:MAG: phosphatase PAP2 family protein [Rubrivivax sp.]|nr:phosphatase PAP2 family protein [Rubrivivax sp.]